MIRLNLPYPVSANRYWRTVVQGKRALVFVSDEAKRYKRDAGWLAKAAGLRQPFACPVELRVTLVPKNGICMDLDNALKVSIDALKGIAYVDDSQVRKITATRAPADGKGGLIVEVDAFEDPVAPQLFPASTLVGLTRSPEDATRAEPVLRVVGLGEGPEPF